jgi:hypothetical protein
MMILPIRLELNIYTLKDRGCGLALQYVIVATSELVANLDGPAIGIGTAYTCPGATSVVKYEKREGGFNRVFLLTMDNGSCVYTGMN